jgi:hypothetical protein
MTQSTSNAQRPIQNSGPAGFMSFSTVLIISLAAGVILIVGGGLMMYMANLVKSAYEIKVQINSEVEERLTKMGDELEKKSRWIKRDLLEEIEKIKTNMQTEAAAKVDELTKPMTARLDALEAAVHAERADWMKAVDSDRAAILNLENRFRGVGKAAKKAESPTADAEAGGEPAAAAPAAGKAPSAPSVEPVKPAGPAQGLGTGAWLPELGRR